MANHIGLIIFAILLTAFNVYIAYQWMRNLFRSDEEQEAMLSESVSDMGRWISMRSLLKTVVAFWLVVALIDGVGYYVIYQVVPMHQWMLWIWALCLAHTAIDLVRGLRLVKETLDEHNDKLGPDKDLKEEEIMAYFEKQEAYNSEIFIQVVDGVTKIAKLLFSIALLVVAYLAL